MFWCSWSADQGGEERQVSSCSSVGPGESIVVKAAYLLEKSPNMGSVLRHWGHGQLTEGRIGCEYSVRHERRRAG